ncbi:MAG: branched-chain amino acid aminotransferase [Alphaproteobacteria bacterium]|jgi:branched-chain amino acid aminotransferase|nr:branched-chain amino acid aminotransferase [Alphaproteobacteria bacterium]
MQEVPYDDRDGVIWMDGAFVPWRDAKVHYLSHALHYASCVFEGMRAYNGQIFELTAHNQRLHDSAGMLGFEVPYSVSDLDAISREALEKAGFEDAYIRPAAWRGPEQMGVSAQNCKIHMGIAVWQWPSYFTPEARMKGIKIDWAIYNRPDPKTQPVHAKAAGLYMICTLSKHAAEAKGYSDALMLDWRGQLAETTGANMFLVIDGKIHTPKPDCFLNGITRQTVVKLAKSRGYEVIERAIMPEELSNASEMFVTGTAAEVTPIAQIADDHTFEVGEITRNLMQDYDNLVNGRAEAVAAE